MCWNSRFIVMLWDAHHIKRGVSPSSKMETPVLQRVTVVFVSVKWLLKYWLFHVMLQERQVALIRELLSDKDTMSRLNDNERQTLMQLSQCHHDDMTSPRKRYESLKSYRILHGHTEIKISLRVLKNISWVSAANEWNIVSTGEERFHISKQPCIVLFII